MTSVQSAARFCDQIMLLSALGDPESGLEVTARRIGAPLIFARLWKETGRRAVIEEALTLRGFEFPVERAILAAVLHRIMVSGSDRACEQCVNRLFSGADHGTRNNRHGPEGGGRLWNGTEMTWTVLPPVVLPAHTGCAT